MNSTLGKCVAACVSLLTILGIGLGVSRVVAGTTVQHVLHISVDGLGSAHLKPLLEAGDLPNFARLAREGAGTLNARTDFDYTVTLPNHTCMLTGRPVNDCSVGARAVAGHQWTTNTDPGPANLHTKPHAYVASAFDVVHDQGLRTGLFASKTKFVLYDQSYDAAAGAPDRVSPDNGRDKIDVYVNDSDSGRVIQELVAALKSHPLAYAFIHLHDADTAGHKFGWSSPEYNAAVKAVDGYLGTIFDLVDHDPAFKGSTAIILSADHGGTGLGHQENSLPVNYTIPFYVWGPGVAQGKDLYLLNRSSRRDPGTERPDYAAQQQPIRNGDGGNLALSLLGLKPIPESFINAQQDLAVH